MDIAMATRHTPRRRHGMRAAAVAFVLATALTACKKGEGGPGEAQAKEPEVEAIPVEVVKAANRPIAASYTGTAALELSLRKARRALATMCVGVGQGISVAIEAV